MSAMAQDQPERHHRPVRRRARSVSCLLAPLFGFVITAWLLFNMIVCNRPVYEAEPRLCDNAHLLPDFVGLLVLGCLVWLLSALKNLGQETEPEEERSGPRNILRHARHVRHGYRNLDTQHRDIAFYALEMSG